MEMLMKKLLPLLGLAACLAGCMSYGNKMEKATIDQIQKGVTTRAEVDAKLGPPKAVNIMPTGDRQAHYMYAETDTDAASFIPYVNLFHHGAKQREQNLVVIYDQHNIVKDYDFTDAAGVTSGAGYSTHTTWQTEPGAK
jgi:outer membrane protein assembly factor BamE (lipoprotein component of BamABCDE complex)